ncbi:MAG TPA: hypothetical protein VHN79_07995, partial [Lacunisphaera sp.]|nr:hypothetical protein [Lacunisphaera sp.]
AAGLAYINYFAYLYSGKSTYADTAKAFYAYYDSLPDGMSPDNEVIVSVGPYIAARLNAEQGTAYDVGKAIRFSLLSYPDFPHDVRINWGAISSAYPGAEGLIGSTASSPPLGYGMPTMTQVGRMIPVAKYAPAYARTVARYAFNAANAMRGMWGDLVPDANQPAEALAWMAKWDPDRSVGYEKAFVKSGQYYPGTDEPGNYSVIYESAWVGFLSGIVPAAGASGNPLFLANINATDFMGGTLQRWLIYNPSSTPDTVTLPLPPGTFKGWNSVSESLVFDNKSQAASVELGADSAAVITLIPASDTVAVVNQRLMDTTLGEVVDYTAPAKYP